MDSPSEPVNAGVACSMIGGTYADLEIFDLATYFCSRKWLITKLSFLSVLRFIVSTSSQISVLKKFRKNSFLVTNKSLFPTNPNWSL